MELSPKPKLSHNFDPIKVFVIISFIVTGFNQKPFLNKLYNTSGSLFTKP